MKNLILFSLLFGFIGLAVQVSNAQNTSVNPAYNQPYDQRCDRTKLSPIKCGYYEEGYMDGVNDARNNLENDYRRYRKKYEDQYREFYREGYDKGYASIKPYQRWNNRQKEAYDRGYNFGRDDRRRNISRLPARYEGRYDRAYEAYYRKGYLDGYADRDRQYDSPVGNRGSNRFPGRNRGRRGTSTGTLNWSGRVDDRVRISLRGNTVLTETVSGRRYQELKALTGVLPRREATISIRKLDGRGNVRVVQQPNRANNYTAIVEIYDFRRSSDNYRLQVTWQASNRLEAYSPGKLTWRGRVDKTAKVRLSGDFVESIDDSGTGMTGVNFDLNGYLANRAGNVRLRKIDGRGNIRILEQPSAANNYTAVIEIYDRKASDDYYEFELTW